MQKNVGVRFHPDPQENNIYDIKYTLIGKEIRKTIEFLNNKYRQIEFDEYIIMPNHVHMIIYITGKGGTLPLQKIVKELKTYTTKKYSEVIKKNKLWQRNYYEHIIRNEKEYLEIKEYIINNPLKWEKDEYF